MLKKKISRLPVLVTRQTSVFPGFPCELDFGRPDSLAVIDKVINEPKKELILVSQIVSETNEIIKNNLHKIGMLCRIEVLRQKQKKLTAKITAIRRVKVIDFHFVQKIFFADYELAPTKKMNLTAKKKLVQEIIEASQIIKNDVNKDSLSINVFTTSELENFIYGWLNSFPNNEQNFKQKAIDTDDLYQRFQILNKNLSPFISSKGTDFNKKDIDNIINKRLKSRLTKQQREYYLREKMREIKGELGELSSKNDELGSYRAEINKKEFPVVVRNRILGEIERYESMPISSAESNMTKNYIDWMMKIPWYQTTDEKNDLNVAQKELDKNHFGLKKAKRRIVEYLASAIFTKKTSRGQIICIVGPPGVGKTSLGISIAKALGRKYVRIALGGVKDEAEIRGHRRAYIGSMPGKIIQALKKAGTINPLILIDEIDKMGSDFRGDPTSAMLEVLDPEQNREFVDHYIEEPYDLSKVMFIATANYEWDIPPALYDRMEIIHLSSYTELEKLQIAKKHLLPRIYKEQNLKQSQIKITSSALQDIIKHYTREAGVRQLNRLLSQICRHFIVKFLQSKITKAIITKDNVIDYLEKRIYKYNNSEQKAQIGVATGLAYTSFGGDILPIETTYFPGKGQLILTGKLGEILRESANIAFDYIKSNHKFFGINFEVFNEKDFHIHLPEGAVPKDGPSAGTALTTALVSLLTKFPISHKIGMTGEITLHGKVLPIGGLTEKSIAAARSGLATIFIPKENEKDLIDVPEEVKKKINIRLVSDYHEIYHYIFSPRKTISAKK